MGCQHPRLAEPRTQRSALFENVLTEWQWTEQLIMAFHQSGKMLEAISDMIAEP